ncbi:nicotinamide-nucleotide amidase [Azovibrio restrictus]|uniref:nicotinamide-nucleotide amidase n=1 Tax=Azovibrio restrictus TaxID=146938 RepID=UPI0026EB01F9|nr:nicotinamide-nucleotide amidase [Azovibrio restrictus]
MAAGLNPAELEALARQVGEALRQRHEMLATAESCTGGWVAQCLTAIAGSSAWFERGFVTYSNQAKMDMLGVLGGVLEEHGAVSEATARAMAQGAVAHSRAQWSLAITGIAGPGGGSVAKPVGTVCFAWARRDGGCLATTRHFGGDRDAVRRQAVAFALGGLLEQLHA